MPVYTLRFPEDAEGTPERIEFSAPDTSEALIVAHSTATRSDAELWLGDARLCTIRRTRPAPQPAMLVG